VSNRIFIDTLFVIALINRRDQYHQVDCISFMVMREAGVNQALTFDHHCVQAGFRALMRELSHT
jgi:predicted nucleic acid-binding protein